MTIPLHTAEQSTPLHTPSTIQRGVTISRRTSVHLSTTRPRTRITILPKRIPTTPITNSHVRPSARITFRNKTTSSERPVRIRLFPDEQRTPKRPCPQRTIIVLGNKERTQPLNAHGKKFGVLLDRLDIQDASAAEALSAFAHLLSSDAAENDISPLQNALLLQVVARFPNFFIVRQPTRAGNQAPHVAVLATRHILRDERVLQSQPGSQVDDDYISTTLFIPKPWFVSRTNDNDMRICNFDVAHIITPTKVSIVERERVPQQRLPSSLDINRDLLRLLDDSDPSLPHASHSVQPNEIPQYSRFADISPHRNSVSIGVHVVLVVPEAQLAVVTDAATTVAVYTYSQEQHPLTIGHLVLRDVHVAPHRLDGRTLLALISANHTIPCNPDIDIQSFTPQSKLQLLCSDPP